MLVEEFSEISDLEGSSHDEPSDEVFPENYYGLEANSVGLISEPTELLLENLIQDPTESDVVYFEASKKYLIEGSLADKYSDLFVERAFRIPGAGADSASSSKRQEEFFANKYGHLSSSVGVCRKFLKKSMGFGYSCIDCMSHNKNSFVCAECFKHSNHQGHRVIKLASSGVCDCGDFDNQKFPQANCSRHRGDIPADDVTTQEEKAHFTKELESFLLVQYSILISVHFSLKNLIGVIIVKDVFQSLKEITEKYPALISVVSMSLLEPMPRVKSFKLLELQNLLKTAAPNCLKQHPTSVKISPVEPPGTDKPQTQEAPSNPTSEAQVHQSNVTEQKLQPADAPNISNNQAPPEPEQPNPQADAHLQPAHPEPQMQQEPLPAPIPEASAPQPHPPEPQPTSAPAQTQPADQQQQQQAGDQQQPAPQGPTPADLPVFEGQAADGQRFDTPVDLLFTYALQLHVAHSKKLSELVVHFSIVPEFKSRAGASWVSCLPQLFSPSIQADEFEPADTSISPLFDLCDQFLVDGKSLQDLFQMCPPVHFMHFMGRVWERMLKVAYESHVIQFLDKRLWEDFLIDVVDSFLANKAWNLVLMQSDAFLRVLIRFFINCYHYSLVLPSTRPEDDAVALIGFVAQQTMDFQATCLTFFGKAVSRLLLHTPESRKSIVERLKAILLEELLIYRNFRCGVLNGKAGVDLSLFRFYSLLCCVESCFETNTNNLSGLPEVKVSLAFKPLVKSVEEQLQVGTFNMPEGVIISDRKFAQLLFVESSRVYGFSKQLAHNLWSFMGDISDMMGHEYCHKCLDTTDRLSLQLGAAELTPAFVFYCIASRMMFPAVPKPTTSVPKTQEASTTNPVQPEVGTSSDPNQPKKEEQPIPEPEQRAELSSNLEAPQESKEPKKPEVPPAGQKVTVLPVLKIRSSNQPPQTAEQTQADSKPVVWVEIPAELEDLVFTKVEAKFGVHEYEKFFWYHEHFFVQSDWAKKMTNLTKAMLLTEYFNTLMLVYTDEYSMSFVCEALLTEIKDSIKGNEASGEKYYMEFLKQELAAMILALSPISVPELLEEAQFLTPEREILERFIEELCEIDTEKHVVRLKKKAKEYILEKLDMSTVSYKSNTHSKVVEGWTNNVDKKLLDKLRLRDPAVTSPFTKFLRYKLASAWPWEVYIATVNICMLVPDWKKVVGPLSSMLKFVHQYLESFGKVASQTKDNQRKIAFEWFITNFLKYLESEVKTSPLLKSFKQKVTEIRTKYFSYGETAGMTEHAETQEMDMEEEQACNQIQVTVDQALKAKFESKRRSAISRIKSKQSHFVNELENTSNEPVLNLKLDTRSDLECAVTKEKISSSNVYYLHTQLHFTNLVSESIRKTLTLIAQNTEVHDSQDVQRALTMVDQIGTDRHLLEDIVLTSCGHIIKSRESASRSVIEIYDPIERPCALCKKPTNLMLPVYPEDLWHRLKGQSTSNTLTERRAANELVSFEGFVQALLDFEHKATSSSPNSDSIINVYAQQTDENDMEPVDGLSGSLPDSKFTMVLKERWAAESKDELISKCKQVSKGATTDMLDFYKQFVGLRSKIADPLLGQLSPKDALAYCALDWSWGNPDDAAIYQVSPLAASCWIFSSNVRYMELKGFANSVKSFGLILHSLYLNMKLCSLNDGMTVQKRVSLLLDSLKKLHLHQNADRTRFEIFALTLLATLTTGYQQEVLFQQILSYFVDLHVQVFLDDEHLNTKWEDLRYNSVGTPLSNSLLRLLRNAALIKFAWKFPVYKTSGGKLFEKIVQFNIKGDSRELDYLFLFLELETPSTLSDTRERIGKVYKWFEADAPDQLQESTNLKLSDVRLEARLLGGTPNFILSLIRLPSHLRLLYDQYLFEACDKCGWHRALLVCLICGDKSCRKRCHPDSQHKNLVACGNATTHSMMHHNGTCAFFDCGTGHILVIEGNRVSLYTDVYKDKFGIVPMEGFHDPSHSVEKYTLSSDRLAEIKANLLNQEVIQSVVLKSLTEEMFYHRNLM